VQQERVLLCDGELLDVVGMGVIPER